MNKTLAFILLILLSFNAHPQTLEQLYDSARANNNLQLAYETRNLAITAQDKKLLANTYFLIAYLEKIDENYSSAIPALLDALLLYRNLNNFIYMSNCQEGLGIIYGDGGLRNMALEYFEDALTLKISERDSIGLARLYFNIAELERKHENYDQALTHYLNSLQIYKALGDTPNLARTYNATGVIHKRKNNLKEAREYYNLALKIDSSTDFKAMVLNNIASLLISQDNAKQARQYLKKALELEQKGIKTRTLSKIYNNLGLIEELSNDSAIYFYERSFSYLKNNPLSMSEEYYSACERLEYLLKEQGQLKKAVYYDSLQDALNASLVQLHKDLNQSNIRYQIEAAYKNRLDAKTKALEERNQILMYVIILLGVLFISMVIAFWLYFKYKKRTVFIYDRVQKAYQSLEKKEVGI